ncbi:hypothetical protein [Microcoleus sp. OTE_8_concoct_300]|uniref:hypothetical protein n=1 Tax=Microcoleus sp. OTE_8_concoct_300 TaxID=2964710 RepID=UPI00403F4AB1
MNRKQYDPHNYSYIQPNDNDTLEQIVLTGELDIDNYISNVSPSKEVCQDVEDWVRQNRDRTRSKIANYLLGIFAGSLVTTFALVGVSSLTPNSDKGLLKDLIPLIITSQASLLGVTIGFYFDKE